ncbi:MAG: helix-turn-helix domain-containing protein, partial [Myxococcaceae bacterium]
FFRLKVFLFPLPPLRDGREVIRVLVKHLVVKFNHDSGKRVNGVHPDALEVLKNYDWPGNIRELRNAVERAVILCDNDLINQEHLPPDMAGKGPEKQSFRIPFGLTLDTVEKDYILGSLQRNGGNKARTAEILGVSEKTLYNKINRYAAEARTARGEPAVTTGTTPAPPASPMESAGANPVGSNLAIR